MQSDPGWTPNVGGQEQVEQRKKHYHAYLHCDITPFQIGRCYGCFGKVQFARKMVVTDNQNRFLFSQMEMICEICWQWTNMMFSAMAPYWGDTAAAPTMQEVLDGKRKKKELLN